MALVPVKMKLTKEDKTKPVGNYVIPKEGVYQVIIGSSELKVVDREDNAKYGYTYINLKLIYKNGKSNFFKIYTANKEGDYESFGWNFAIAMRKALEAYAEENDDKKLLKKISDIEVDSLFSLMIRFKIPFYLHIKIFETDDNMKIVILDTFQTPMISEEEMNEYLEKKKGKIELVDLSKDKEEGKKKNKPSKNKKDEEEDDYDDEDDEKDDLDDYDDDEY